MNWKERIEEAKKVGMFATNDVMAAGSWNCCALGEKYKNDAGVTLVDDKYDDADNLHSHGYVLGMAFYEAVRDNKIDEAERIYNEIMEEEFKSLFTY